MKARNKLFLISGIAMLSVVATLLLTHLRDFSIVNGGLQHNEHCEWNHYSRVEPTYNDKGIQEYYVCCDHHESVLERPATGVITNKGTPTQEFINSLEDSDFRVIPSYKTQLEPIQSLIDKIGYRYAITDGSLIDKAYRDYNALSGGLKAYVQNVDKLNDVYESYHENYEVLIDTTLNEYQCQIYNSTYDLDCLYDDNYGYYSAFSNITMQTDCWFGMGRNDGTSVSSYHEVFFYAFNESLESRSIQIRDKYDFELFGSQITLAPHQWTKIEIPMSVFVTRKLDDLFIGSYLSGMTGVLVEQGFRYTSLYASKGTVEQQTYINLSNDDQVLENVDMTGNGVAINEADYGAHVLPTSFSATKGQMTFITSSTYSNITQVSFDAKIDGTSHGWWGVGHNASISDASLYTNIVTTSMTSTNNEFKHVSFNVNVTGPEYIYVVLEVGQFEKDLYIDNFTITCGAVNYTDGFDGGTSALFNTDPSVVKGAVLFEPINEVKYYMSHNVADYHLEIETANYGGDPAGYRATFITTGYYDDILSIAFDAKIIGEMTPLTNSEQIWWGFGVGSEENPDYIYDTQYTKQRLSTDNKWMHFEYSRSGVSGYVKFVINPGKTTCPICIDNIVINTLHGSYVESFSNNRASLFNVGQFCSIEQKSAPTITFGGGTMPEGNHSILMDIYNYGNRSRNAATLYSKNKYANITNMSFDIKIDGTITYDNYDNYWFGVGHSSSEGSSIYTNIQTRNIYSTNNEWMHLDFTFTNVNNEYLFFVSNPVHGHNDFFIDNIVIVANGVTYTDDLENGSELFDLGLDVSLYTEPGSMDTVDIYDCLMNSQAYFEGPNFIRDNLPNQESLVFGSISHNIQGNGQYSILIYNDSENVEYLLINSDSIKLYTNHTLIKSVNTVSQTYEIVVTNSGKISINGTYMGQTTEVNDAIRFISCFNEGTVIFTDISLFTSVYVDNSKETIDGIEVPVFEDAENVVFAAYGSMTIDNWDGSNSNPNMLTDADFQDFVDAGFSKAIPLYEGRTSYSYLFNNLYDQYLEETDPTTKESYRQQLLEYVDQICEKANHDAMIALAVAERYGVQYVVLNAIIFEILNVKTPHGNYIQPEDYEMIFDRAFNGDDEYLSQVAYYGNFVQDEPSAGNNNEALVRLMAALTLYYQNCERLGIISEPVINLLPGGYTSDYISYLDFYFANVAPMVGYVSFDQYVLDYENGTYSIREDHLANLEMMAQRILASNHRIQLRTYIFPHAVQEGSHRAITMADELRFQIYTNLVFGASEIIYYGYTCHTNSDRETTIGLVNMYTKEKSQVYYFAKEVNNEVLTFGSAYRHFTYEGMIAKDTAILFNKNKQIKKLKYSLSSHAGIKSYSVSENTLIGCFGDVEGQYAYVLMHYADPKVSTDTDTVTIKFNNYNAIIVYQNGEKHAYRLTNNSYTLTMQPGCGAFIIPINLQ